MAAASLTRRIGAPTGTRGLLLKQGAGNVSARNSVPFNCLSAAYQTRYCREDTGFHSPGPVDVAAEPPPPTSAIACEHGIFSSLTL